MLLLPRFGMKGFLAVILLSCTYTCAANTGRLLFSSGTRHAFRRWLGAPVLAALTAGAAGTGVWRLLAKFLAGIGWHRLPPLPQGERRRRRCTSLRHCRWGWERS